MDDDPPPKRVPLDPPRELDAYERALLDLMLVGPLDRDDLRRQAAGARVEARCSCGCSSIFLSTGTAPAARMDVIGPTGTSAYVATRAVEHPTGPDDRYASAVTLHVLEGRLYELEIFNGDEGDARRPRLADLRIEAE